MKNMKLLSLLLLLATTQIKSADFVAFKDYCDESMKFSSHLLDEAKGEDEDTHGNAQVMLDNMNNLLDTYKGLSVPAKQAAQNKFADMVAQYINEYGILYSSKNVGIQQYYISSNKNASNPIPHKQKFADVLARGIRTLEDKKTPRHDEHAEKYEDNTPLDNYESKIHVPGLLAHTFKYTKSYSFNGNIDTSESKPLDENNNLLANILVYINKL